MSENEGVKNGNLFLDVCQLIESLRTKVANQVNSELTILYWNIGNRINRDILENLRADYGKQIVATLSGQLQKQYGDKGFDTKSIRRMIQFASTFSEFPIVATLSRQLSWSHFMEVMPIKDELQRDFYITMCSYEKWSVRTLRAKINGMLYERTLISGKDNDSIKNELIDLRNNNCISPDLVFRSPYFLDFTGLKGYYSEKSLEDSLLVNIEQFILELGVGFSFIERQKRIIIDGEDFYIDLLFYHRKLKRLIVIDLKLGRFKAQYKGQMELYLRWLEKNEMEKGESSPLGLILCTEGSDEQIELLELDKSGIKVAQYFTELPAKNVLQEQVKKQLQIAKERFANRIDEE
ncbi:MAG: PDDEXK nuclease domain-containing protein [Bacteroidales bacterium]